MAPDLIDAIGEFATQDKPKNLQLVKLVIFQQDMIPTFEETFKSKAGASYKKHEGFLKRGMSEFSIIICLLNFFYINYLKFVIFNCSSLPLKVMKV